MVSFLDKIKTMFSHWNTDENVVDSCEENLNSEGDNCSNVTDIQISQWENIYYDSEESVEDIETFETATYPKVKSTESVEEFNVNWEEIASQIYWNDISTNISDHDIDLANKPIDFLDLSERTKNALINHWVLCLKDFWKYSTNIVSYGQLRWLWKKAILELDNAFKKIEWYRNYSIESCKFYIASKLQEKNTIEYVKNQRKVVIGGLNKEDIEIANDSIDVLCLSERTYKALIKNDVIYLKDFAKFSSDIRWLVHLRWLWAKAIMELNNGFKKIDWYYNYSLKNCKFYIYWKIELQDPNILHKTKVEKSPYFEIDNRKYYLYWPSFIAFKEMRVKNFLLKNNLSFYDLLTRKDLNLLKGAWRNLLKTIYNFNKEVLKYYWVRNIDDLELPAEEKLDFLFMFSGFYAWILDFEKKIIWLRSDRFNRWWSKVTLEEIWQDSNLTRERVRQLEVRNTDLYCAYLNLLSEQIENFLIEQLAVNSEYSHLYYWEIEYSSTFSISFLQKSFYEIFKKKYWFYWSNDFFFFFKLTEWLDLKEIQILLNKIDKFYYSKKIKDQILTYDIIFKNVHSNIILIKPLLKYYLLNRFWIDEENWTFVFPFNKRDYDSLVMWELEKLENPIHFSNLYKIICKEYPQFKFKEQTVYSVLWENEDAINVGKWLYIHIKKRPFLKWLKTSEDVIVKYLSGKERKRATVWEIVYFVKQYKDVDTWSIEAVLNLNKYWNFVKINNKEFWLKGYW